VTLFPCRKLRGALWYRCCRVRCLAVMTASCGPSGVSHFGDTMADRLPVPARKERRQTDRASPYGNSMAQRLWFPILTLLAAISLHDVLRDCTTRYEFLGRIE
jgi:hypothetical protein